MNEDIIEEVFLIIQNDPTYLRSYRHLADDLRDWVVNNWIGVYVKEIMRGTTIRQVAAKRSNLITGYTKLR